MTSHFEFMHPWFLLLALLLPLLALRPYFFGGRARLRWSNIHMTEGGGSLRTSLAKVPEVLGLAGVALLIVALARPQLTHRERVVESEGIDIVLALDTSGSMDAQDFEYHGRKLSRLELAKAVVSDFVEAREHDRISLVVFGEEAFTQVPLTLDHQALLRFLDMVQIGMAGENATAIGQAIAVSTTRLDTLDNPTKVVILLTDGQDNAKGTMKPLLAAEAAAALGVRVYTIGVGSTSGGGGVLGFFSRRGSAVDESTLEAVAETTGAKYFRATNSRGLQEIYNTIDGLERSTAEVKEYVHRDELYRYALLSGLLLLALRVLLDATLFRRIP
ncbi:MAG TPA: VWA domain-containing protein [Myxococcota bacterium]|nr:VWA domain-containing protein [Myxococcota bacterium]